MQLQGLMLLFYYISIYFFCLLIVKNISHPIFVNERTMQNFTIQDCIQNFGQALYAALHVEEQTAFSSGIESLSDAKNEIFYLLSFVLKKDKVFLISHGNYVLSNMEWKAFVSLFERRKEGEPLAYIVGQKEFFGHLFFVDSSTLIPRPDTEILVEEAILFYLEQEKNTEFNFVDLGTGTGCILLSLLKKCEKSFGCGIDINAHVIDLAKQNAHALGLSERSRFFAADFTSSLFLEQMEEVLQGRKVDCLVSNPPYIPEFEYNELDESVRAYEPKTALVSEQAQNGEKGLAHAEKIIALGEKLLKSGGLLLIEHGYNQGKAMRKLCAQYHYTAIKTLFDLAQNERALYAIKK